MRKMFYTAVFAALVLVGIYPDQLMPLAVATIAGMMVLIIERLIQ